MVNRMLIVFYMYVFTRLEQWRVQCIVHGHFDILMEGIRDQTINRATNLQCNSWATSTCCQINVWNYSKIKNLLKGSIEKLHLRGITHTHTQSDTRKHNWPLNDLLQCYWGLYLNRLPWATHDFQPQRRWEDEKNKQAENKELGGILKMTDFWQKPWRLWKPWQIGDEFDVFFTKPLAKDLKP